MEFIYRKTPGLVYDMLQILTMKISNVSQWIEEESAFAFKRKYTVYEDYMLSQFPDLSADLFVFFYRKNEEDVSYFQKVFGRLIEDKKEKICKEDFIEYLKDVETIKTDLFDYLLDQDEMVEAGKLEPQFIAETIEQQTDLSHKMKHMLLHFFLSIDACIEELRNIFDRYYQILEAEYEKRAEEILQRLEDTDMHQLALETGLVSWLNQNEMPLEQHRCMVSFTLLFKSSLWLGCFEESCIIAGEAYDQIEEEEPEQPVDMEKVGKALGDETRIQLIDLLLREGRKGIVQLEAQTGVSLNNLVYHLDIMKQGSVLTTYGKRRYYSYGVNIKTLQKCVEEMQEWIRGTKLMEG